MGVTPAVVTRVVKSPTVIERVTACLIFTPAATATVSSKLLGLAWDELGFDDQIAIIRRLVFRHGADACLLILELLVAYIPSLQYTREK